MLYSICKITFLFVFKVFFHLRICGRDNLPQGGFIIASNHNSLIDPPLIGASIPRSVYFMAKKELFDIPILGKIIESTHAFPIDRKSPSPATFKKVLNLLISGKILLVFPEGTRKSSRQIHRGVAVLAHKANVPVVPSRIYYYENIIKFPRLIYKIGHSVRFPISSLEKATPSQYRNFSHSIMDKINSL